MNVLYIDDNKLVRFTFKKLVDNRKHNVLIASGGTEGIAIFSQSHPDLVITDLQMPNMDGLKVLEQIKKINPKAKVWLVSFSINNQTRQEAIRLGASKALDKSELIQALGQEGLV